MLNAAQNIFKKIKSIVEILLFILVIPAFFLLTSSKIPILGIRSFTVLTGSMEPHIPVGSMILVKDNWPYQVGDVITFANQGGLTVTHRVVDKLSQEGTIFYQLKGDANSAPDVEYIPEGAVVGKQLLTLPYIGRAAAFVRTFEGLFAFVILPSLLFIAIELWNIKKEFVKETEKRILAQFHHPPSLQGEALQ